MNGNTQSICDNAHSEVGEVVGSVVGAHVLKVGDVVGYFVGASVVGALVG